MLLFPYACVLSTPGNNVADLGASGSAPPEALTITEERGFEVATLLSGKGLARFGSRPTLRRLRLASPQDFAIPNTVAGVLKGLAIGDACQLSENLSSRSVVTVWTNLIVSAAPVVTRLGYDQAHDTEYFSYQLEFIQMEA